MLANFTFDHAGIALGDVFRTGDRLPPENELYATVCRLPGALADGQADVVGDGYARGHGNELRLSNAALDFNLASLDRWPDGFTVCLRRGTGGNFIEINRERKGFDELRELDGVTLGGAELSVVAAATGADGLIKAMTQSPRGIRLFAIGGVEMNVDEFEFHSPDA